MKGIAVILEGGTRHQALGNRVKQIRIGHRNEQKGFHIPKLPIQEFGSGLDLFY